MNPFWSHESFRLSSNRINWGGLTFNPMSAVLCYYDVNVALGILFFSVWEYTKPSLKIGSVSKAFLFWYWQRLKKYFCRSKTFLLFKIESWNFQHLLEKFSLFRQFLIFKFLLVVWLSWNFVRFHEILFQTDAENFSFLSWQTKKCFFLKNIS